MVKVLTNWSKERDPSKETTKKFETLPKIEMSLWTEAFKWYGLNKRIVKIKDLYFVGSMAEASKSDGKLYLDDNSITKVNDFDMLIRFIESLRVIKINETWQLSSCNCRYWHKHFICKHIIGISFNLGLCQFPAVELNVEDNRKKSRPSKAISALLRDRGLVYPTQLVTQTVMTQAVEVI